MSHFDLRANLIERRNVEVTPDWAAHYLKFNTYEHQRAVRVLHVDELAEKMKDGRFRFGEIAFGILSPGKKSVMVNGQHQCNAIIKSGETVPCILEKYRCLSAMDLADLFRQFEYLPRSVTDMVKAKAGGLGLEWPVQISSLVVAAATIDHVAKGAKGARKAFSTSGGVKGGKTFLSKEQKVGLLELYLKEGTFMYEIMSFVDGKIVPSNKNARHLQRAPVAYVMFLTMRKNAQQAATFWVNVRDGENLTKDMPEMRLREFLMSVNSHATPYSYRTVKQHEYIYKCVTAWNAFRKGLSTTLRYSPSKDIPAVK